MKLPPSKMDGLLEMVGKKLGVSPGTAAVGFRIWKTGAGNAESAEKRGCECTEPVERPEKSRAADEYAAGKSVI